MTQLALFEVVRPVKRTHDWLWRPWGPSECAACQLLWFPDVSRAEVRVFLTEDCPVKAAGSPRKPFSIVYLA